MNTRMEKMGDAQTEQEFKTSVESLAEKLVGLCIDTDGLCDAVLSLVAIEIAAKSIRSHVDRGLLLARGGMREEFEQSLSRRMARLKECVPRDAS